MGALTWGFGDAAGRFFLGEKSFFHPKNRIFLADGRFFHVTASGVGMKKTAGGVSRVLRHVSKALRHASRWFCGVTQGLGGVVELFCGLKKCIFHMKNRIFGSRKSSVGATGFLRHAVERVFHVPPWFCCMAQAVRHADLQITLNEY